MTSTSIPVKGDRDYIQTIKTLAAMRSVSIAELVRAALDATYGMALEDIKAFSIAQDAANTPQMVSTGSVPQVKASPKSKRAQKA